ncbi:MAG TPA: phosphate ABC transporter permease subunit PstC, partial [Gemmatimonadales bacterium]|nr:phosphate ABC transporter permease subunit PstC [Gemmatimonadales bacterium]
MPPPIATKESRWSLRGVDRSDRIYRRILVALALALPLLILLIFGVLFVSALPALGRFGPSFLWTSTWDPVAEVYGAAPMIFGTLASSLLALLIAVPLALSVAIFLTEFAPRWLRQPVAFLVELLAAIPSVVYGLWGVFVLIPFLRSYVVPPLKSVLGWTPLFQGVFYGNSLLAGGIILAIMIVPYIAAVSREVLLAVPVSQREAALAMGATRWEAVRSAVLPYGRAGLIGAVILGLGR